MDGPFQSWKIFYENAASKSQFLFLNLKQEPNVIGMMYLKLMEQII